MEDQVEVKIVTVDAVTNLENLRKTIKDAKDNLSTLTIGSDKYREQLVELNKAQNLLTNALNGTTATEEDYVNALQGNVKTYNTLVKQMADMKKQLRNIDVSTEEGAASFKELASKINDVNDELKEMDAMKGDFQRNVGNYKSALEGFNEPLKAIVQDLPSGLNGLKGPMDDVTKSLGLMGKQPILGIIGLLAPLISQITSSLGENKAIQDAIKKVMDSMKPVMDFFAGILETVGQFLAEIIEKAAGFLGSSGIFNKIIQGVMGVGNAILKYVTAPFKGVIEAIKVFKEQGIAGFKDAAKAFGHEMKEGFSFKKNFESGQTVADTILNGMASKKPEAKETGKSLAKETADAWEEEMQKRVKEFAEKVKARTEAEKYLKGLRDATQADIDAATSALDSELQTDFDATLEYLQNEADAEKAIQEQAVKNAREAAQQKLSAMQAYVSGASGLLNGIADMLEEEGQSAKNLRIAAATIDMISGAVAAYSTAQKLGPPAGPIVGAINAAAVVASGLANIAKIRATNVSKDSAPTSSAPAQATVSAPALETAVPTTTVVNGARTEAALNNASQPQRVYILQDDIEAAGEASRVQVAEASF